MPKSFAFLVLSLLFAPLVLRAQVTTPQPTKSSNKPPIETGAGYSNLQGITYFYLDVSSPDGVGHMDADFRNELRDLLELEFRRANMTLRVASPVEMNQNTLPLLSLSIRYDPNVLRTGCELDLRVYDRVSINRNKVQITSEIFKSTSIIPFSNERILQQNIKHHSRQIVSDLLKGIKK